MGVLRLLLAVSVVNGHFFIFNSTYFVNAGIAVVAFFVISGFYMAMVINEKYATLSMWRRRFLLNRAFRLLPVYFVILFFLLLLQTLLTGSNHVATYAATPGWQSVLVVLNFTIVGQDIYMWLFDTGATTIPNPVLNQPAWSVASEIIFYAVAAFTFRGKTGIVLTFIAAVAMSWTIRGFNVSPTRLPLETFIFFACGGVSYLLYGAFKPLLTQFRLPIVFIPAILVGYVASLNSGLLGGDGYAIYKFAILTAVITPILFEATRYSNVDAFLGDLSYPLYLVHMPANIILATAMPGVSAWLVGAVSMLLSVLLALLIDKPMDRLVRSKISSAANGAGFNAETRMVTAAMSGQGSPSRWGY